MVQMNFKKVAIVSIRLENIKILRCQRKIRKNQEPPMQSAELSKDELNSFYRTLGGHIYFQSLSAAVEFDLFNVLEKMGPSSEVQIAKSLNINEQACRILLLPLTTLDLLKLIDDKYSNSKIANYFLCSSSPHQVLNVVRWQHFINYKAMYHFFDSIKSNANIGLSEFPGDEKTLYQRLTHDSKLENIFQLAMQDISTQAQKHLSESIDLTDIKYLIDVGGGNASNIITLAKKFPSLRASVFDSQSVCEIASENINKHQLSGRLNAVAGDCFSDPFPKADCILFCHFFTIWSKEKNLELLQKSYKDLPPGGRAMIFNMMQNNSKDGPLSAAMGSPYFLTLATGTGMLYTWNEYIQLFEKAGFKNIQVKTLPMDHGVIWGTKPS